METEPQVFLFFSLSPSPSQRTFEGPRKKVEEVAVIPTYRDIAATSRRKEREREREMTIGWERERGGQSGREGGRRQAQGINEESFPSERLS